MDVLVTGGTGFVGTALCRELDERGHDVTALSRDPSGADLPQGVETYAGDVTDHDDIEGAFEGQDAVVHLVALSSLFKPKGGYEMYDRVNLGGTENVVSAAADHGLDRILFLSGLGADPDSASRFLRSKGLAEAEVRESDLEGVIVRPSVIFGDGSEIVSFTKFVTTPYVTGLPSGGRFPRFQLLWIEDLAPLLAACVEDDDRDGETYEFGGPQKQDFAEVTRLVYRAEGKPVKIVPIPLPIAKVGLTLADHVPFVPMGSDQYHGLTLDNTVEHNDVEAFGVDVDEMRTFADWLGVSQNSEV